MKSSKKKKKTDYRPLKKEALELAINAFQNMSEEDRHAAWVHLQKGQPFLTDYIVESFGGNDQFRRNFYAIYLVAMSAASFNSAKAVASVSEVKLRLAIDKKLEVFKNEKNPEKRRELCLPDYERQPIFTNWCMNMLGVEGFEAKDFPQHLMQLRVFTDILGTIA